MESTSLLTLLGAFTLIFLVIYAIVITGIIVLDNRSPQATFAWLFLMLAFPVLGLIIYLFFGRGHGAFSSEEKLARMEIGQRADSFVRSLRESGSDYMQQIARERPASYRRRLLEMVQRNSSSALTAYNAVEILQDAAEKYPRLLADVQAATHSIHMLYFIWTEDEFTIRLKDALIERAKAGVEIRILVDQSNFTVSQAYKDELHAAGVDIRPYKVYKALTRLHTANYRSHRKTVVIDGKIAYMGGMNLDQGQLPGHNPLGNWRDTHLRMEGEAALPLQASFAASWLTTTGEKIIDPLYYPPVDKSKPFVPIQITQGGPDSQWKAMSQLYFRMIMSAEDRCYIQSPFFIPDESLLEAIQAAALSGVDVRIICTPRGAKYQFPYRAANTYFADVRRAGAKVYLYNKGYYHCKTISIDGAICAIGTANFDIRSFQLNYETMAVIYDDTIAAQLEADFLNDLKDCDPWSLNAYRKSPIARRLVDSIFRLASPIL
jgi:cardiolipin synthase A/B